MIQQSTYLLLLITTSKIIRQLFCTIFLSDLTFFLAKRAILRNANNLVNPPKR